MKVRHGFMATAIVLASSAAWAQTPFAIPPPAAFSHPGYLYYNGAQSIPLPAIPMPPALSRLDPTNTAHLKAASAQPSRCNVPKEVAPNVFVHLDCTPYKRIAAAVKHASPLKLNLMRLGRVLWQPMYRAIMTPQGTVGGTAPTSATATPAAAAAGQQPAPDLVDHRLSGTEGPVKDQGDVGACTAFAFSSVLDNSLRRAGQNVTTSPEHVWGHYASPTMDDAAAGNLNKGITTFQALPYSGKDACELTKDVTDDCGQTYNVVPNTAPVDAPLEQRLRAADQAGGHRAVSYEELSVSPPNLDELVTVLASGVDIWAAFAIDSSIWENRQMQNFVIPDWTQPDGGHSVDLAGYRKVNGGLQFLVHNSWGSSWGDGGYAWISQAMVLKWLQDAYKVRTDVDAGSPTSPLPPATDEDCPGDQVIDSVTKRCATICPDQSRPANGACPNGAAPAPQPLTLPTAWPTGLPPIPSAWPWPVPSGLPQLFAPPAPPP
jgi:hypothetical protein